VPNHYSSYSSFFANQNEQRTSGGQFSSIVLHEPLHVHTKYVKGLGLIKGFNITDLYSLPTVYIADASVALPSLLLIATLSLLVCALLI
jgi:hypothetical protein